VNVKARAFDQPPVYQSRFVCAIVIKNHMDVQILGHIGVNDVEKLAELYAAVAAIALADHLAIGSIEGGKQRSRSIAAVVVGATLHLAKP